MRKICIVLLTCLLYFKSAAQDKPLVENPKNVIHASVGTSILAFSANLSYDRLLKHKEKGFFKSYNLTLQSGGLYSVSTIGSNSSSNWQNSVGLTALTGSGKKHFELKLGLGYLIDTRESFNSAGEIEEVADNNFFPSLTIGYREQISEGFVFRTGLGIPELAYVGFGYSF